MKDKININIPAFGLKLSYFIPIILVLILGFTTLKQWNSTKGLRNVNKELLRNEKNLNNIIIAKDRRIESDSLLIVSERVLIDSLKLSDDKHKKELNSMNIKYEKLKIDYNSATSDDKWDIFTRSLHN